MAVSNNLYKTTLFRILTSGTCTHITLNKESGAHEEPYNRLLSQKLIPDYGRRAGRGIRCCIMLEKYKNAPKESEKLNLKIYS